MHIVNADWMNAWMERQSIFSYCILYQYSAQWNSNFHTEGKTKNKCCRNEVNEKYKMKENSDIENAIEKKRNKNIYRIHGYVLLLLLLSLCDWRNICCVDNNDAYKYVI